MSSVPPSKRCTKCGVEKPLDKFNKKKGTKYGVRYWCKKCQSEYNAAYYEDNREMIINRQAKYYEENIEKERRRGRIRRRKHADYYRELQREYRKENREKRAEWDREYRARKNGAPGGGVTEEEWAEILDKYGHQCLSCGESEETLAMDHIVPLSEGGAHDPSNVQPLCTACNSSKHTKIIDYRPDHIDET